MSSDQFWTSQDGQILTVKTKDEQTALLTLAFWPRLPAEFDFMKEHRAALRFTERSSLARIGIEMILQGPPTVDGNRLVLEAEAFLYDQSFPNAPYWKKLLRPGTPVGRLFHAPAAAKLSSTEIWDALRQNLLKLPNTISIDSGGRVFFTPHPVSYTLNPRLQRLNFEHIVSGYAGRSFIDKVQVRHDAAPLAIPPQSGVLTSCSMYLKEHYVVLNPGEGNFGLHTSAVLLDPIKTFGTNIMLEIYNTGAHPVVNPMVSVEVFRAPHYMWLLLFVGLWGFALNLGQPFYSVYILRELPLSTSDLTILTTLQTVGGLVTLTSWGVLGDRFGSKPVMLACSFIWVAAGLPSWLLAGPDRHLHLYLTFFLVGAATAGFQLCQFNLMVKMIPARTTAPYISVFLAGISLMTAAGPLVGGQLLTTLPHDIGTLLGEPVLRFHVVFVLSLLLCLVSTHVLQLMQEPAERPLSEVVRVMRRMRELNPILDDVLKRKAAK